jgi:hypothetical protein
MKIIFLILSLLLVVSHTTKALSLTDQLKQQIEQLHKTPEDDALREKIIKQVQKLKPAPDIPGEARAFQDQGKLAFNKAMTEQDYVTVAHVYEKALALAPWVDGIYFQLGAVYEKAGRTGLNSYPPVACTADSESETVRKFSAYSRSAQYFKWYLLARPDADDRESVRQRMDERAYTMARWKADLNRQCCEGCRGIPGHFK